MSTNLKLKLIGLITTIALFAIPVAGSLAASATQRVPPRPDGQWTIPWLGGTEHLTLGESRFRFFFNHQARFSAHGRLSLSGDKITFRNSNQCTGTGTYEWSLSKAGLTFVQAAGSSDPCPREPVLTSGTWTRP